MTLCEFIAARRSIRRYQPRLVEPDKLEGVLQAARNAPSAGNLQPLEIVVVTRPQSRAALCEAALGQGFVGQAPVVLVFLMDVARSARVYGARGADLYVIQDTAIACAYAQLAATSLGLGSCWIGAFHPQAVGRVVRAPQHLIPSALLTLGYADEAPDPTPRRPLDELAHREAYGAASRRQED